MLATSRIPHFCYGFCNVGSDSLELAGPSDIFSSNEGFVSSSNYELYLTPDELINETQGINELDFNRIQDGKRKQPDYILVFKDGENINHLDDIVNAYHNWGEELPIVVIDIEKCLKSEREKIVNMIKQYRENPNDELKRQIEQKVENNRKRFRVRNGSFCKDLEIEKLDEKYKKSQNQKEEKSNNNTKIDEQESQTTKTISLEDLAKNYEMVSASDREKAQSKIQKIYKQISEIQKSR